MKITGFIFLLTLLFSLQPPEQKKDLNETYFCIAIPLRSGLASADFNIYEVKNDSLYVLYQPAMDTTGPFELEESYRIEKHDLEALDNLLLQTDSFGSHTSGIFILGQYRFYINATYQGKALDGYIANCYREHIFVFTDWLNKVYPNGHVIKYNKEALIEQERIEEERIEKRIWEE